MASIAGTPSIAATRPQQAESAALAKELGVRDLLLAQILLVIVPEFFGTAVKAGQAHVLLWLLAILLFFIPQALVVSYLNRLMPLEGGLFEWARAAFGDCVGFLVAWNVWLTATVQVSQVALVTTTYASYALGPQAAWIASSQRFLLLLSVLLIAGMMLIARVGLRVGKWIGNAGSVFTILIIAVLSLLPLAGRLTGTIPEYHPLRLARPALTLFMLSVFAKMTFGALSGFDTVAIFAGESRRPGRSFARATFLATPVIALLYIFGTSSILAFVSPEDIDIIGPIPQALQRGLSSFGGAGVVVPAAILLLLTNYLSSYVTYFSANSRLPMVAGWDQILPAWFTRLHERYKTPVNAIWFMGAVALGLSIAALIGVKNQEAFAMLQVWTWTFYGLAYCAMFAIPLVARKEFRPGWGLRLASASGFVIALAFVLLSVSPIIPVENVSAYTVKTIAVVLAANAFAVALYFLSRHRESARAQTEGGPT